MAFRYGANRYPRPGERIAPTTLSQVLSEPIPRRLAAGTPAEGLTLADLDESVWEKLPPQIVLELADLVLARVAAGCARRVFHQRHLPHLPETMRLDALPLERRTRLCLAREGIDEDVDSLGGRTIGDVLSIRAFGPRCLVDLLSAMESQLAREKCLDERLTREAEQLAALPDVSSVRGDDSRFRALMSEIDADAQTAEDLAASLVSRSQDPPDPLYAAQQVRRLRQRIVAMRSWTLEEELTQIFASTSSARNREILIGYYGWNDGQSHTLAEIGKKYGLTRERTRQICARLIKRRAPAGTHAPVMDRVLAFVVERLPRSVPVLESELRRAGLTVVTFHLENIATAASVLGRAIPFEILAVGRGRLAVQRGQSTLPVAVIDTAKKEVYYHGLSTVERIVGAVSARDSRSNSDSIRAAAMETLPLVDGFCWLDRESGWFRLSTTARHGVAKTIEKILAVTPRIRMRDLASAVGRSRRIRSPRPPVAVLEAFCRQTVGIRVDGEWVIADPARPWKQVLTGVEAHLVEILTRHGPIMERSVLEDRCVENGMNRFSCHAYLASSPIIAQYGYSVYGLPGVEVPPDVVESLLARRRAERLPMRVLDSHGRMADGRLWLSYRLSKAASTYAVITVPAEWKDLVRGKFDLVAPGGRRVGILAAKDGRAWGLGGFLRQHGARRSDRLVLTLDLNHRTAAIAIEPCTKLPSLTP